MGRSKWKGPFVDFRYLNSAKRLKKQENTTGALEISRSSEIMPAFLGLTFQVHNGKSFNEIVVNEDMIGHRFGEFSFTRSKFIFKKKKQKK